MSIHEEMRKCPIGQVPVGGRLLLGEDATVMVKVELAEGDGGALQRPTPIPNHCLIQRAVCTGKIDEKRHRVTTIHTLQHPTSVRLLPLDTEVWHLLEGHTYGHGKRP
jgi:hypothetical protein